jgi:hypothetical protein
MTDSAYDAIDDDDFWSYADRPQDCPNAPHRGPQGPNEDISSCWLCAGPSWALRPEGETFGRHAPDCSLAERHPGYCVGGGTGHPDAEVIRG